MIQLINLPDVHSGDNQGPWSCCDRPGALQAPHTKTMHHNIKTFHMKIRFCNLINTHDQFLLKVSWAQPGIGFSISNFQLCR